MQAASALPLFQDLLQRARQLAAAGDEGAALPLLLQALQIQPGTTDARYELASLYHRTGRLADAEREFRLLLQAQPHHTPSQLGLSAVLLDARRPGEAETIAKNALSTPVPPALQAALQTNLGLALRRQRKDREALRAYDAAKASRASAHEIALHRAEALQNLGRYEEAMDEYREALARFPQSPALHLRYNYLLHRLGRDDFLKSYAQAAKSPALRLGQAALLLQVEKPEAALAVYRDLLTASPGPEAFMGAVTALIAMGRPDQAALLLDPVLPRQDGNVPLLTLAATVSALRSDPERGLALCERALALTPRDQGVIATASICARMTGDERDEFWNDYDGLIRIFDLEPPAGFSTMKAFNAELAACLKHFHSAPGDSIDQSLRGGTQTTDHLFGAGHHLVELLRVRIDDAIADYVSALGHDPRHPLRAAGACGFDYAGSWSSLLRDCGFHRNHIHQDGWISSCYYVELPDAVQDAQTKAGWIKFGEPSFAAVLDQPVRRTIQPIPGRLILFPSYTWHGTVPFRGASRLTVAFDLLPVGPAAR